jgi:hypothetical protein
LMVTFQVHLPRMSPSFRSEFEAAKEEGGLIAESQQ